MDIDPDPESHKQRIKLEIEMMNKSDFTIVQSDSQFNLIKNEYTEVKNLKKIQVIPSGIRYTLNNSLEETIRKKDKEKEIRIIFVGRIDKNKGVEQLLEAFEKVKANHKNVRLDLYGKGPELKRLEKKYSDKKTRFHGFIYRGDLEYEYEKSHIFCMPSYSESFGNTVIESMIFGAVPIFTKGPSVPKLFEENVHGLKIPLSLINGVYKPNPKDIQEKIEYLLNNKSEIKRISKNTFKFSRKKYSIKRMAKETRELYEKCLKS